MPTSARINEIRQWASNKKKNSSASTAQTDLTIALAYIDELAGSASVSSSDSSSSYSNMEAHSESQADYMGYNNQPNYQPSSLAQQIDGVEKNLEQR